MVSRDWHKGTFEQQFKEDKEKAVIELPGGKKIAAYALEGSEKDVPEIIITLVDEYGYPMQDLAVVRQNFNYVKEENGRVLREVPIKKEYQVLVMGNEEDDTSYTDEVVIKERPEPEPEPEFNADQYDDWEGHYSDHDEMHFYDDDEGGRYIIS